MLGNNLFKLLKISSNSSRFLVKQVSDNVVKRPYCISGTNEDSLGSNFNLFNIKKTLKLSGIAFEDGFTCLKLQCPVCDRSKPNLDIFINKTTGDFVCPSCHHSGKWKHIDKYFGSAKSKKPDEKSREAFIASKKKTEPYSFSNFKEFNSLDESVKQRVLQSFGINSLLLNSFHTVETHYDEENQRLIFPLRDYNGQCIGYKVLNNNLEETTVPEGGSHGCIVVRPISSKSKDSSTAILVLNILDLLALNTHKLNATTICLPYGCKSLPQECLPLLESFQKLILWFDYDTAGWDSAKTFSKKLEGKRCVFVRPTDLHPVPYQAIQQNLDVKSILSKAQPILHKSITTFSSLRQDVLSDLQNIDKVLGVKWKRYPALNKYLKGHRKGELTVLTGPTGCGKTTFMSEYSLDLALQGVNTLWGSFEIRNTRLASTLLRQMAGHPLDNNLSEFDFWADEFEKLPIYFMTFHGQQSIKIVMDAIEHAQYVHDIHHVIIDNVQFMMGMSDESKHMDRFWKQDAIIAAFRTFATKKNCHVTLVIHPRKEREADDLTTSSIFGSAKAAQEADNVLIIQDKRLTSVRGKKYLQVAKNRYTGDLGIMPMDFDKLALSYAPKKKKQEDTIPSNTTQASNSN